jgi:hypothetical protein
MVTFRMRYVLLWGMIYFFALCGLHCFIDSRHLFFGQFDRDLATALVGCLCYMNGFGLRLVDPDEEPGWPILKFVVWFAVIEVGRYCLFGSSEVLGYYILENTIAGVVAYISGFVHGSKAAENSAEY